RRPIPLPSRPRDKPRTNGISSLWGLPSRARTNLSRSSLPPASRTPARCSGPGCAAGAQRGPSTAAVSEMRLCRAVGSVGARDRARVLDRTGGEWPRARGLLPADRAGPFADLQCGRRGEPRPRRLLRLGAYISVEIAKHLGFGPAVVLSPVAVAMLGMLFERF